MSTFRQTDFFINLLDSRQFPAEPSKEVLLEKFKALDDKNASDWIEKAMNLPKKDAPADVAAIPAPF